MRTRNRQKIQKKRRQQGCPRQDKEAFWSEIFALQVWARQSAQTKKATKVYKCKCGYFHIGRPRRVIEKL